MNVAIRVVTLVLAFLVLEPLLASGDLLCGTGGLPNYQCSIESGPTVQSWCQHRAAQTCNTTWDNNYAMDRETWVIQCVGQQGQGTVRCYHCQTYQTGCCYEALDPEPECPTGTPPEQGR